MKTMIRVALVMALMSVSAATTWVVAQKWTEGVSAADKKKVLDGVKEMAAKIPGMKNVWIKGLRVQPEGYTDAFAIEFENQAAADRYAKDPVHDKWTEEFAKVREATLSPQITND
jgi:Stress responsive A/B Barrel Domain